MLCKYVPRYLAARVCEIRYVMLLAHGRTVKVNDDHDGVTSQDYTLSLHPGKNSVTYEARLLKALLLQVT